MDSGQETPDPGKGCRFMGMDLEVLKLARKGTFLLICGGWHFEDFSLDWCASRVRPFVNHCIHFVYMFPICILFLYLAQILSPFTTWMAEPLLTRPPRPLSPLQQTTNPAPHSAIPGESHVTFDPPVQPPATVPHGYSRHPPHDNPPTSIPRADTANTPGNTSQTPQNPTTPLEPAASASGSSNPPPKNSKPGYARGTAASGGREQPTRSGFKGKNRVARGW